MDDDLERLLRQIEQCRAIAEWAPYPLRDVLAQFYPRQAEEVWAMQAKRDTAA